MQPLLNSIDWDNLSPVYRTMFEERFRAWDMEDRKSAIQDLKFLRELRKRMQENAHFGAEIAIDVLQDLDTMIGDITEALMK